MREKIARNRRRKALSALPLALLGLFLVQAVLLPAHGMPAHESLMSAVGTSSAAAPSTQATHAHHGADGVERSGHGHAPHDGGPVCHVGPHYADIAMNRLAESEFTKMPQPVLLIVAAGLLAVSLVVSRPPSGRNRWSTRPHWRPAGAALLVHVCIART